MKLVALRPQSGVYGTAAPGDTIEAEGTLADKLLASPNWAKPADAKKHFAKIAERNAAIKQASMNGGISAMPVDTAKKDDKDA